MARGRHPGMQREAGHFCHPRTGFFQAARRRQALQAEGLAALMRTHRNAVGDGTAQHTFQAGVILRLQPYGRDGPNSGSSEGKFLDSVARIERNRVVSEGRMALHHL